MRYRATHITEYRYEEPVAQCLTEAHLTPRSFGRQHVRESTIEVTPEASVIERRQDYYGNEVASICIFKSHDRFTVKCTSIVDLAPLEVASPIAYPPISWEETRQYLRAHPNAESLAACEFTFDSPFVAASDELAHYAAPSLRPGRPLAEAAIELSSRIHKDFAYKPKSTSIDSPLTEVMRNRCGVCQDFAHVMIGALRSHRLAARYVSGYLKSGVGSEASHAWVSVYVPGYGWLDLDPTNNAIPSLGHVTVAWGRDYGDVTPVKGISLGGGGQTVEVDVRVVAIDV